MKKRIGMCVIVACLLALNGFGQAAAKPSSKAKDAPNANLMSMSLAELQASANTLLQQGDTNAAIKALTACNETSFRQNANEFSTLLNILLKEGKLAEAQSAYQNTIAQHDSLTRDYYNRLRQYYISQNNAPATLEWTASLQTKDLPPALRAQAFAWLFEASRTAGPVSRVTDLVSVCIAKFDATTSHNLLNEVIRAYDGAGDQASANKVLDAIEHTKNLAPELRLLATSQRINLLFSSAKWTKAEKLFQNEANTLPDVELAACFQHARTCAIQAKQLDLLDGLCSWILKEQKKKPLTWQAAAGAWLENAKIRKSVADILARLEALMQMGCPNKFLAAYYYEYWSMVVKDGKPADLAAISKFGDKLSATLTDKRDKEIFQMYAFVNCIVSEDYAQALKMLEKPLPNMKPPEQQIAINKIKAHLALQKGNKPEAVELFRAFMETVKTWPEPEVDPITGMIYTKEMCLGMNAKRIGDILSSMNDAKGAQAAYLEADGYYTAAQKEARVNSPESAYIKTHLDELGKLIKK